MLRRFHREELRGCGGDHRHASAVGNAGPAERHANSSTVNHHALKVFPCGRPLRLVCARLDLHSWEKTHIKKMRADRIWIGSQGEADCYLEERISSVCLSVDLSGPLGPSFYSILKNPARREAKSSFLALAGYSRTHSDRCRRSRSPQATVSAALYCRSRSDPRRGRCPWNGLAEEGAHDDLTNWARHNCRLPSPKAARRLTKSRLKRTAELTGGNDRLPRAKIFTSSIVRSLFALLCYQDDSGLGQTINEFETLSSDNGS
jgi:hypothetical protein